jgi:hypothetical protein
LDLVKKYAPQNKPMERMNVQFLEIFLLIFHSLAHHSMFASKENTGIFVPMGQPGDNDPELAEKKTAFLGQFQRLLDQGPEFSKTLAASLQDLKKSLNSAPKEQKKEFVSFDSSGSFGLIAFQADKISGVEAAKTACDHAITLLKVKLNFESFGSNPSFLRKSLNLSLSSLQNLSHLGVKATKNHKSKQSIPRQRVLPHPQLLQSLSVSNEILSHLSHNSSSSQERTLLPHSTP